MATAINKNTLEKKTLMTSGLSIFAVMVCLFGAAGTFKYWQAWNLLTILIGCTTYIGLYLYRKDPNLLERRMRYKEPEPQQQVIISLGTGVLLVGLVVAGFDFRFSWSRVPLSFVLIADLMIVVGYWIIFETFKVNTYTARTVAVEKEQKLISWGPYAIVRHPMYVGTIFVFLALPFALGSYSAIAFSIPIFPLIVWRILNEEKVLCRELEGYKEYTQKVKYRILPGVW